MYLCNFCFLIIIQHNFHWCCHLVCWASKVSQTVSPVTWWEEVRSSEWHKSTQRRPSVRYCLILEFKAKYKFSINKFWYTFPWLQLYLIIHVTVGLFSFNEKWQKNCTEYVWQNSTNPILHWESGCSYVAVNSNSKTSFLH